MNSFNLKGYKFIKDQKYTWKFIPEEKLYILTNLGYDNFLTIKTIYNLSQSISGSHRYQLFFNLGAESIAFNFKDKNLIFHLSNNLEFLEHKKVKLQLIQ
jgi:hypothetical protein